VIVDVVSSQLTLRRITSSPDFTKSFFGLCFLTPDVVSSIFQTAVSSSFLSCKYTAVIATNAASLIFSCQSSIHTSKLPQLKRLKSSSDVTVINRSAHHHFFDTQIFSPWEVLNVASFVLQLAKVVVAQEKANAAMEDAELKLKELHIQPA